MKNRVLALAIRQFTAHLELLVVLGIAPCITQPIAAVNRVPLSESALANMAQGGTGIAVFLEDISSASMTAANQVADWRNRKALF